MSSPAWTRLLISFEGRSENEQEYILGKPLA